MSQRSLKLLSLPFSGMIKKKGLKVSLRQLGQATCWTASVDSSKLFFPQLCGLRLRVARMEGKDLDLGKIFRQSVELVSQGVPSFPLSKSLEVRVRGSSQEQQGVGVLEDHFQDVTGLPPHQAMTVRQKLDKKLKQVVQGVEALEDHPNCHVTGPSPLPLADRSSRAGKRLTLGEVPKVGLLAFCNRLLNVSTSWNWPWRSGNMPCKACSSLWSGRLLAGWRRGTL